MGLIVILCVANNLLFHLNQITLRDGDTTNQ